MTRALLSKVILLTYCVAAALVAHSAEAQTRRISQADLLDKFEGGWAGQMIGNIQGLPYEFKFKDEPGPIPEFTPDLPECKSDDDTDIELMHFLAMDRLGVSRLPYAELARQWTASVNQMVWIANERARDLMREGVLPPWTSHPALNEHSSYNLSGQFCAESFGLIAPGMPQTAGSLGSHYTLVTIRGEPLQATAWTAALVSLAFFENDVEKILAEAEKAVDPKSQHAEMLRDVTEWAKASPEDWRPVRDKVHQKYLVERGWNWNATITNGAFTAMGLIYGKGDFAKTLQLTFAFGYDADNNAALCGTIIGVIQGSKKMRAQPGWKLPDVYVNYTRDDFPKHMTMEYIRALTLRLAERVIVQAGGKRVEEDGIVYYDIPTEAVALVAPLGKHESKDDLAAVTKAMAAEAAAALSQGDTNAQTFAAIRLAHMGGPELEKNKDKVRAVLEKAVDTDPVLTLWAEKALEKME